MQFKPIFDGEISQAAAADDIPTANNGIGGILARNNENLTNQNGV